MSTVLRKTISFQWNSYDFPMIFQWKQSMPHYECWRCIMDAHDPTWTMQRELRLCIIGTHGEPWNAHNNANAELWDSMTMDASSIVMMYRECLKRKNHEFWWWITPRPHNPLWVFMMNYTSPQTHHVNSWHAGDLMMHQEYPWFLDASRMCKMHLECWWCISNMHNESRVHVSHRGYV